MTSTENKSKLLGSMPTTILSCRYVLLLLMFVYHVVMMTSGNLSIRKVSQQHRIHKPIRSTIERCFNCHFSPRAFIKLYNLHSGRLSLALSMKSQSNIPDVANESVDSSSNYIIRERICERRIDEKTDGLNEVNEESKVDSTNHDIIDTVSKGSEENLKLLAKAERDYGTALADIESIGDEQIQLAVKNSLQRKEVQVNPLEVLSNILTDIKSKSYKEEGSPKPTAHSMLEKLFPAEQSKDPFDEKRVMIKLYKMMQKEDFDQVFKDPIIGEFL